MGLDVTAYRKLTKLDVLFDEHGEAVDPATREPIDRYMRVRENPDFPGRAAGLEDGAAYSYEDAESFWSGAYGRYNSWREQLATLADYPLCEYTIYGTTSMRRDAAAWAGKCDGMPFVELVNFSDCDGTIGPVVAAKLARDFAAWTERAEKIGVDFYAKFMEWRRCFEFAADGGAVCFH